MNAAIKAYQEAIKGVIELDIKQLSREELAAIYNGYLSVSNHAKKSHDEILKNGPYIVGDDLIRRALELFNWEAPKKHWFSKYRSGDVLRLIDSGFNKTVNNNMARELKSRGVGYYLSNGQKIYLLPPLKR